MDLIQTFVTPLVLLLFGALGVSSITRRLTNIEDDGRSIRSDLRQIALAVGARPHGQTG